MSKKYTVEYNYVSVDWEVIEIQTGRTVFASESKSTALNFAAKLNH